MTFFLVSRTTPSSLRKRWCAASCATSVLDGPGVGSSHLRGFAQPRYLRERPTSAGFRRWSIVRIDEHGSKDRARTRPVMHATISRACVRCLPLGERRPTSFPSSASSGHPLSSARSFTAEEPLCPLRTDRGLRSDVAPRRAPPSGKPGCLSPSRHAKEWSRGGFDPSGLRAGSPAHAVHTFPAGSVLLMDIASVTVRSPAGP